jgi:hypothetical protein
VGRLRLDGRRHAKRHVQRHHGHDDAGPGREDADREDGATRAPAPAHLAPAAPESAGRQRLQQQVRKVGRKYPGAGPRRYYPSGNKRPSSAIPTRDQLIVYLLLIPRGAYRATSFKMYFKRGARPSLRNIRHSRQDLLSSLGRIAVSPYTARNERTSPASRELHNTPDFLPPPISQISKND